MAYSFDFCKRVLFVKAKEGLSFVETAERFGVGVSTLLRWSKNQFPKKHRNKGATKLDMEKLKQDISLYPDSYQYERAERLGVSRSGVWHALRRLKVTFKKNVSSSKSGSRKAFYILPKA